MAVMEPVLSCAALIAALVSLYTRGQSRRTAARTPLASPVSGGRPLTALIASSSSSESESALEVRRYFTDSIAASTFLGTLTFLGTPRRVLVL